VVTRRPLGLPFGKILPNTSGEDEFSTNSSQILLGKPFRLICCDSKSNINLLPSSTLFAAVVAVSSVDEWSRVRYIRLDCSGKDAISFHAPPRFLWGG
jgi:hypothetical protein